MGYTTVSLAPGQGAYIHPGFMPPTAIGWYPAVASQGIPKVVLPLVAPGSSAYIDGSWTQRNPLGRERRG